MKLNIEKPNFLKLTTILLDWYDQNHRVLPWRESKDPYTVWISEIILQQTKVAKGIDYYEKFISKFPDSYSLANANVDEVLLLWKGLGYYSRAINLHRAANQIQDEFSGVFPTTFQEIQKLRGVGKYTAAAIASISFGQVVAAVDGNFYRVLSRVFADPFDISSSKAHASFFELAMQLISASRPGDFNQAIMDLGAGVCKPKNPECPICPIQQNCQASKRGVQQDFPVKTKKTKVTDIFLSYYFVQSGTAVLIAQRDQNSIWKRLYEFPKLIPADLQSYQSEQYEVLHKLSHQNLHLCFHRIRTDQPVDISLFGGGFFWCEFSQLQNYSFPKPLHNALERWALDQDFSAVE